MIFTDGETRTPASGWIERLLGWILYGMGLGLAALLLLALAQPGFTQGARFFVIGLFAAVSATALAGIVGMIFALPETAGRAPVPAPDAADGKTGTAASADWFVDNSSLERIATWLTGAIIALSIANFEAWTSRLQTVARAIGAAMWGGRDGEVWGTLLLSSYGLLGFIAAYLWTRRFLPAELANARKELRDVQRQDDSAARLQAQAARSEGDVASVRVGNAEERAKMAVDAASADAAALAPPSGPGDTAAPDEGARGDTDGRGGDTGGRGGDTGGRGGDEATRPARFGGLPPVINPSSGRDDPWKGQFGGLASRNGAVLSATVQRDPDDNNLFLVALQLTAAAYAGRKARLYLHPSFARSIRTITIGPDGSYRLPLVCWGAFTVGVQFEDGNLLELDLSQLDGAPADFRAR